MHGREHSRTLHRIEMTVSIIVEAGNLPCSQSFVLFSSSLRSKTEGDVFVLEILDIMYTVPIVNRSFHFHLEHLALHI